MRPKKYILLTDRGNSATIATELGSTAVVPHTQYTLQCTVSSSSTRYPICIARKTFFVVHTPYRSYSISVCMWQCAAFIPRLVMGRRWRAGPGLGWAGPTHKNLIWWAAARPGPSKFQRMGRGPARSINFSEDGPRPGPAHHIKKKLRPSHPGPSFFQKSRPGPARPTT